MSSTPPTKSRPQRPKSAAKLASEANTRQQLAVRTNAPRPNDRQPGDPQGTESNRKLRRLGH